MIWSACGQAPLAGGWNVDTIQAPHGHIPLSIFIMWNSADSATSVSGAD